MHEIQQGEAVHHAYAPCQSSWIDFPSHPMTTMIAANPQGTVLPMYVSAPQMTTCARQYQRHNDFICSASPSDRVSPEVFPSPPELNAAIRCAASGRIANVNAEQKAIRPKSCTVDGKGNGRRKKENVWRLDDNNGEKNLRREEILTGAASRSQRQRVPQHSHLARTVEHILLETAAESYYPCGLQIEDNEQGSGTSQSASISTTTNHESTETLWPCGFTLSADNPAFVWADEMVTDLVNDA